MCSRWPLFLAACAVLSAVLPLAAATRVPTRLVGVARVDVTPSYPIRLSGYAARSNESTGVLAHIYVRALALSSPKESPAILLSVENCGVPGPLRDEVAQRLKRKIKLKPERFSVCSTHTHSAPLLSGNLGNLFGGPLPSDQQQRVQRYTSEVADAMEQAALQAVADLQPGQLTYTRAQANFAANRRSPPGPVDHDLPALFITDDQGKVRAVWASYACHCTTMTAAYNVVCGDWAGFAMSELESEYPGAVALITIGCGGDSNPSPRPGEELVRAHAHNLVTNVVSAWHKGGKPVGGKLVCRARTIELAYDKIPAREEYERRLTEVTNQTSKFVAAHAQLQLARLNAGESLPKNLDYYLQTWVLGGDLAFVFLPGEVVSDYSLRLKRELDAQRIWVNAYANDVPCYIPSERVLAEGGYEGGFAMIYYDRPTRFAPGLEDRIIGGTQKLLPVEFKAGLK